MDFSPISYLIFSDAKNRNNKYIKRIKKTREFLDLIVITKHISLNNENIIMKMLLFLHIALV